jgi:hypothetical protein
MGCLLENASVPASVESKLAQAFASTKVQVLSLFLVQ